MLDRRLFLRLLAFSSALLSFPLSLRGAGQPRRRRIRCTVLRRECYTDLQSIFLDDPDTGPCNRFTTGQQFDIDLRQCPEGFCPKAWNAIRIHASGHSSCSGRDSAVIACPDGTRPVIFRLSYID